jgi:hypothetical protein
MPTEAKDDQDWPLFRGELHDSVCRASRHPQVRGHREPGPS